MSAVSNALQIPTRLHLVTATLALLQVSPQALAGPPLRISDPGILDPGRWEVVGAGTVSASDAEDYYELPLLDVSLGVIQDLLQVSVVLPYVNVDPDPGASAWDFGNLEFGATLRLYSTNRLQMALAPSYAFAVDDAARRKGIGVATDVATLPLNAELHFAQRWWLNAEIGYVKFRHGEDAWIYGAAAAHAVSERWKWLFELSGTSDAQLRSDALDARIGFDANLNDSLHLLFSVATGLVEPAERGKLDFGVYVGLQYLP